jgi:uncharacterized OB-fold protein
MNIPDRLPTVPPIAGLIRPLAEVFLEQIGQKRLCVARCRATGEPMPYAAHSLDEDVIWEEASGRARLASFTVLWQSYRAGMAVPYNVAWVELEEGPRLISTIAASGGLALHVGMPLKAQFAPDGLLTFMPAASPIDKHDAAKRGFPK